MEELLNYDIESILLSRTNDVFSHQQRVTAACEAFLNSVSSSIAKQRAEKNEYQEKVTKNAAIVADVSNQIQEIQNEFANIALRQKVVEKQISNILQKQEKVKQEIVEGRSQEENYSLQFVDLEKDAEEKKIKRQMKWDTIKRACSAYKLGLQFRIEISESSDVCDRIRIIFFELLKDVSPQYYVDLIRTADLWRVELIHPSLSLEHQEQLKCVVNFEKQQEISDITAFLCLLREIFKELHKN
ncbi:uncharacterized protein LOC124298833 isoform X1 [Neodiprion virginianus]|uniref:uncharacterized protein LOC124298833 isoform X1 n=1 Tax=Neodiprion virginianus TaxID=2961670 RepID=UPI001EE77797|nr:uncharacterized protein LOC124298833 isoform X1 [Neodiprion virginianus]